MFQLFAIVLAAGSATAGAAPPTDPAICASRRAESDKINKRLARSSAEGAVRSNAKSARLREAEEQSLISLGNTVDPGGSDCPPPKLETSRWIYLLAAIRCEKDRLKASSPPSCDDTKWQPYSDGLPDKPAPAASARKPDRNR